MGSPSSLRTFRRMEATGLDDSVPSWFGRRYGTVSACKQTKKRATMRVGVDFGKVIGLDDQPEPVPLALPAIRHLVGRCGSEHVFIVSKAGPEMELRIRTWLDSVDFYNETKVLRAHLVFVRTYEDKARICNELALDWFVDDHVKVVRALAVNCPSIGRVFWFGASTADVRLLTSRRSRAKVVIASRGWPCVLKALSKAQLVLSLTDGPTGKLSNIVSHAEASPNSHQT